jgi:hypothetical protein
MVFLSQRQCGTDSWVINGYYAIAPNQRGYSAGARPDNHIAISYVLNLTYVLTKTLFKHQHEEIEMNYMAGLTYIQIIVLLRLKMKPEKYSFVKNCLMIGS